jgi:hypothetical protein
MTYDPSHDEAEDLKAPAAEALAAAQSSIGKVLKLLKKHDDDKIKHDLEPLAKLYSQLVKLLGSSDSPEVFAKVEGGARKLKTDADRLLVALAKLAAAAGKEEDDEDDDKDDGKEGEGGVVTVKVVSSAVADVNIKNAKMAQALRMVAEGQTGRAGPKVPGITQPFQHIHIGGDASWNLLFRASGPLVLGTVEFHIEKTNNAQQKEEIKKVANRAGATATLQVDGDKISKI